MLPVLILCSCPSPCSYLGTSYRSQLSMDQLQVSQPHSSSSSFERSSPRAASRTTGGSSCTAPKKMSSTLRRVRPGVCGPGDGFSGETGGDREVPGRTHRIGQVLDGVGMIFVWDWPMGRTKETPLEDAAGDRETTWQQEEGARTRTLTRSR